MVRNCPGDPSMAGFAFEATLKAALDILLDQGIEICKIILFGSHAKGWTHANSDIDLCLVVKNAVEIFESQNRLNGKMGLAQLNVDVILVSEDDFENDKVSPIIYEIRKYGKTIYEANHDGSEAIAKQSLNPKEPN